MEIRWFGHSFFEITTDTEVKKRVKLFIDPYSEQIGLKPPQVDEADVVLVSHNHFDHNNVNIFRNPGLIVDTAGEYSIKGTDIKGLLSYHDNNSGADKGANIIFIIESEGIRVVHLGDLGHLLNDASVKKIDGVDILMVPVGGPHSLFGKESVKVIKQLEPKIVIPMHYKILGVNIDLADITEFCKEIGMCPVEPVAKLDVKAGSLEGKEMEVVIMQAESV